MRNALWIVALAIMALFVHFIMDIDCSWGSDRDCLLLHSKRGRYIVRRGLSDSLDTCSSEKPSVPSVFQIANE